MTLPPPPAYLFILMNKQYNTMQSSCDLNIKKEKPWYRLLYYTSTEEAEAYLC